MAGGYFECYKKVEPEPVKQYSEVEIGIIRAHMIYHGFETVGDAIKYIEQHHPHLLTTKAE